MMDSTINFTITNAYALCNMGVTFMQQRCYRQAIETMSDALTILKQSYTLLESTPSAPSTIESSKASIDGGYHNAVMRHTEEVNQRALERLANPKVSIMNCSFAALDLKVQTVSDYDLVILDTTTLDSCAAPFRILKLVTEDVRAAINVDSLCSILLYNMAIAHLCLSDEAKSTETAIKLLNLSYSLHRKIITEASCSYRTYLEHPEQITIMDRILCSLIQLWYWYDQIGKVKILYGELQYLRKQIMQIQKEMHFSGAVTIAAAAA